MHDPAQPRENHYEVDNLHHGHSPYEKSSFGQSPYERPHVGHFSSGYQPHYDPYKAHPPFTHHGGHYGKKTHKLRLKEITQTTHQALPGIFDSDLKESTKELKRILNLKISKRD